MHKQLAQWVTCRQADVGECWQAAVLARLPQMTPEQREAVGDLLARLLPVYLQLLESGSAEPLDLIIRWLAPAGMLRRFTLAQLQEIAGSFHEVVWPLVTLQADGDIPRLLAGAEALAECCLRVTRAVANEYQRRILSEANEATEFGFILADVTRSVTASLNLDEVLPVICEEGARLMEAERTLVRLLEENGALVCRAAWGQDAAALSGTVIALDDPDALCSRAVRTRRPQTAVIHPGAAQDHPRLQAPEGRMCLAIPIIAKGEVLGAMLFVEEARREHLAAVQDAERVLTAELLVAQTALSIYNARLHTQIRDLVYALDHIGECVLITNTAGRICYANCAVRHTLGYEPRELVGLDLRSLEAGRDGKQAAERIIPGLQAGGWEAEEDWRHRSGTTVPMRLVSAPVAGEEGQCPHVVVLARDVTEEKRRQQEESATRAQLQGKNRELEAFVYTVSHDLRAPLVALHGLVGMLQLEHGQALGDAGQHLLCRLDANVVRMERLINDLLQFSRVGRRGHQTEIAVAGVLAEILEDWRLRLDARGMTVTVREPLPAVRADHTTLRQVFENLLGNAVKFMGENAAPVIEIGGDMEGDYAHLYVRDNGIGIAPEYQEKVFDIFQRVHDLPDVDGTGVGLAIVKKAVESWNGRVWIESAVNQGCAVHVTVPLAPCREPVRGGMGAWANG